MKPLIIGFALLCAVAAQAGDACCGTGRGKKQGHHAKADHKNAEGSHVKKMKCSGEKCADKKDCKACPAGKAKAEGKNISTKDLAALLQSDDKPVIFDARGKGGFSKGHIPGARHLSAAADEEAIKKAVGDDKSAAIVTYCGSVKCPASSKLAGKLRKLGYTNVTEYPEGIAGWSKAGNKVGKAD